MSLPVLSYQHFILRFAHSQEFVLQLSVQLHDFNEVISRLGPFN